MKYVILSLIWLFLVVPCAGEIIIVDDDWPADFNNIQAAVDYSADGDIIYVLPGTYTGAGNYDIGFGGKGITVQSVDPHDPYIVSATVIDHNEQFGPYGAFDLRDGEDANSVISGFTISNCGTGVRCYYSSPTISHCNLVGNRYGRDAGGIYLEDSNSLISNCAITDNIGSGIYCTVYSDPTIANCTISRNTGWGRPGFTRGGGIYCQDDTRPTIKNCLITANGVDRDGGGICTYQNSSPKIINCTITGNAAGDQGGGIFHESDEELFVSNSIVWSNVDESGEPIDVQQIRSDGEGTVNMWFSCVQDGNANDANIPFGGAAYFNIDDDPCFVTPGAGYWDDNNTPGEPYDDFWVWSGGDYHLRLDSPCVEAANPYSTYGPGDTDMDGQPRVMGPRVDIGADEAQIAMITVTKPAGGEVWAAGSVHNIEWDSFGITGTVDVAYSINNGVDWVPIESTADTGSYLWYLPEFVDSNQCLVSVEPSIYDANAICAATGLFAIIPYSPGPAVASRWKSLGGDFDRSGLSDSSGPELGCVKWQFQTSGPVSAGVTVSDNNVVHIACQDGNLYTLDANGLLLWSYEVGSPLLSSPTIGPDGTVYVGSSDNRLYAIDVNGDLRWTHSTDGFIYSSPAVSSSGNRLYVCSQDGTVYALYRDGSEHWTFEVGGLGAATGAILGSPAVGPDDTVYVAGVYDSNLYAIDPMTGALKWAYDFNDPCEPNGPQPFAFASPVVAADGTIYQTLLYNRKYHVREDEPYEEFLYDARLYALDPNGDVLWAVNMADGNCGLFDEYQASIETGLPPYPYAFIAQSTVKYHRVSNSGFSEPALGPDGTIYVSFDDAYIRAVEPNGQLKWATRAGWIGNFTLTVGSDGLIYAAGDHENLYVLDPNGKELARFEGHNWLAFPVIAEDGTLIVSDANDTVWALTEGSCGGQPSVLHRVADLDYDRAVGFGDIAALVDDWLKCSDTTIDPETGLPPCDYEGSAFYLIGDVDRNQHVDLFDFAAAASAWMNED